MNKAHVTDLLSDFLEGGLSYAGAEKVKAHLAFCNRCRQELEETKHQRAVLRTTPTATPPAGLEGRVLTAVRKERERMPVQTGSGKFIWPSWFTPLRGLALAATCGIVLVVVRNLPRNAREQAAVEESSRALAKDAGQAPVAIARREAPEAEQQKNLEKEKAQPFAAPPTASGAGAPAQNEDFASANQPALKQPERADEVDKLKSEAKPMEVPMTAAPAVPPVAPPAAALQQAQESVNSVASSARLEAAPQAKTARMAESKKVVPLPGAVPAAPATAGSVSSQGAASPLEGSQSAIGTPRELVIKDPDVWQALWKEHTARVSNPPPTPAVDFGHQDVIAIFAGQVPTGGHRVVIDEIGKTTWNGEAARVVRYHVTVPPPGVMAAQVISYPYLFSIQPHFEGQTFFQKNR